MAYNKTFWEDLPSVETPITAENLNKIEQGIYNAHESIDKIPDWVFSGDEPSFDGYTKAETDALLDKKANAIITKASGETVVTADSANATPSITLFGKSEQDGTPSLEVPIDVVPHGASGSIEQWLHDNNLIPYPYSDGSNITTNGVTFTEKNGVITVSGTPTTIGTDYNLFGEDKDNGKYIFIPKGNYNYSYDNASFEHENTFIGFRTVEKGALLGLKNIVKELTDTDLHVYNIFVRCGNTTETYNLSFSPVLTLGNSTEFIPRSETQTIVHQTPNGLHGIPLGATIHDVIKNSPIHMSGVYWDNATSQYYIGDTKNENGKDVKRIKVYGVEDLSEVSISSDKNWYDSEKSYSYELKFFGKEKSLDSSQCFEMSTHFVGYHFNKFYQKNIENGCLIGQAYIVVNISKSLGICKTPDEFKQYCVENNVKFYKVLKEPIVTDLTEEELAQYNAIHMNYPNTTIVNSDSAYTEVEYVADTKCYIDKKFKELEVALANTNAQLL